MLWLVVLSLSQVPPTSPPPLVPFDEPPPSTVTLPGQATPPPLGTVSKGAEAEEAPQNALLFSPASLGALYFSLEYERALGSSLSVFGAAGVGLLTQYGFDAGLRWYPLETMMSGLFLDGRVSTFGLFAGMFLIGPGVTIGYQWVTKGRLVLSAGVGATLWYAAVHQRSTTLFALGGPAADAQVFLVPGVYQPPAGELGVEPTVRLSLGFGL